MKLRLASPSVLVDIGRLTDLSYVRDAGDHVAIGALTRHRDLETSDLLERARAAARPRRRPRRRPAGAPPRHDRRLDRPRRPGVGPARRSPWPSGRRTWRRARTARARSRPTTSSRGFLESALAPDELLTEIRVPKMGGAGWSFQKFNRRAQDWAIVGVAACAPQRRAGRRPGQHGLDADPRPERGGGAGAGRVGRRRRRAGRRRGRAAEPTSTPASSTASTWPRSSSAAPWSRRAPPDPAAPRRDLVTLRLKSTSGHPGSRYRR